MRGRCPRTRLGRVLAVGCAFVAAVACAPSLSTSAGDAGPLAEDGPALAGRSARDSSRVPIALRARDGGVLPLRSLEVRGEIEGPLAFTELHLEFENGEPTAKEGVLELVLPTRARLARFAVDRGGVRIDAEVVPREALRPREGLHAKTPPAVDYGDRGQLFRVLLPRVEARARTRVVVSYRELLSDPELPYRVNLAGLPQLERFVARVRGGIGADRARAPVEGAVGTDGVDVTLRSYRPVSDLVLRSPKQRTVGVAHGGMVAARIRPLTHDHHAPLESIAVLFDTSASRAPRFEASIARLRDTLDELARWTGPETRVHLVAFDQGHETIYEGPLSGLAAAHFDRLRAREALGASDLGDALRYLRRRPGHRYDRLLLVTDGVVTAGTRDLDRLTDAVRDLGRRGLQRIDVLEDGGLSDHSTLRRLTRVLPRRGMVLDPREPDRALVRRLLRGVVTDVAIDVPGASWVYPGMVEGVQAGDELIVFAEFSSSGPGEAVTIEVSGEIAAQHRIELQETAGPLLRTAIAEAHVQDLSDALLDSREQPRAVRRAAYRQLVELSQRHRLLNDFTRFAMADAIGDAGVEGGAPPALVMGPRHAEARLPLAIDTLGAELNELLARFPRRYLTMDRLALVLTLDAPVSFEGERQAELLTTPPAPEARTGKGPGPGEASSPSNAEAPDFVGRMRRDVQRRTGSDFGGPAEVEPRLPTTRRKHWSTWSRADDGDHTAPERSPVDAQSGNLLAVMNLLAWGEYDQAERYARAWRARAPDDPLALVALGESYEARRAPDAATRAYGSLIDLYPDRPDVRRFAGTRLEGLSGAADGLAIDTFRRALEQEPDAPSGQRALALALLRRGQFSAAFGVLEAAVGRRYDPARFGDAAAGLREDLGLVAAAWLRNDPAREPEVEARLAAVGATRSRVPSVRMALSWETPGSDADLHVRDAAGHHAYHGSPHLPGGGRLLEDVSAGFGVERFVDTSAAVDESYELQVHHFSRGPLGYGMGQVEILVHDGDGGLDFELRPFVVTRDRAYVDLGRWRRPKRASTPSTSVVLDLPSD